MKLRLVALLLASILIPAYVLAADATPPALPPLPAIPSAPTVSAPLPSEPTQAKIIDAPQAPSLPLSGLSTPPAATTPEKSLSPLADLPPPMPESSDVAKPATTAAAAPVTTAKAGDIPAPPDMPNLPLPAPPVATPTITMPVIPMPPAPVVEVKPVEPKPNPKTWLTHLAPSVVLPQTNFNYRRQILPPTVSSASYDRENQHLPPAVMREDYEHLLFVSVAHNDVEAARALLNRGTPVDVLNTEGETPLMLANRLGARNVAALLVARGAKL